MTEAIAARALQKTYGGTTALAGASLSVDRGEAFALVGPNGAGKTTLVRALTGTTAPDDGEVRLLGGPPGEVRRRAVGLLPQSFDPPGRLTARELVNYYAGLYDDHRDPEAVLEDVGLAGAADTRYGDLSGGQRRRACVGTALVNDPEVLFLDEPTTGIDPSGRRDVWELLEGLLARGATVFLTTHDMAEAERLGDRVGLLADGELLDVGAPDELIDRYGGPARLVVETDAPAAAVAGSGFDARRLSETSVRTGAVGSGLVFEGVDPTDISDVVATLAESGHDYGTVTWFEPALEDVYLALADDPATAKDRRGATAGGDQP
ncbi:MAG: ABC transporter ATP-binding protein [Halobacteriales archaeon]